ncbi:MAG: HAD-IC family P-type ATPase, partial [Deltaproteobacteria bacterium]|nr:HAD-IC family P-type ATPase [Deltaproteobacteria bacterium]
MLAPNEPWSKSPEELAELLGTDAKRGLSSDEAARRLSEHGPNALGELEQRSKLAILAAQFNSILVVLLALAATVSLVFAQWVEAAAVFAVLIINGMIGFFTELRAVRSMEALRSLGVATVVVRRDGKRRQLDARELVLGDLVLFEGGDLVSADIRLVEASRLQANESLLTGEAVPVGKRVEVIEAGAEIADRKNMLFRGTALTRGAGSGLVTASGRATEVGQISELVASAEAEHTPLEKRLNKLGQALVWVTLLLALLIGLLGLLRGADLAIAIQTAIALAVASVPEGLPIIATLALARGMRKMVARNALVNRLSAVETLGATSIICTDKTGTLTENRMTVELYDLTAGQVEITEAPVDGGSIPGLDSALRIGVLCNDASLDSGGIGDPLEVALLRVGDQAGMAKHPLRDATPRVRELAFDPDVKMMATIQKRQGGQFEYSVKGAPESVLDVCTHDADGNALTEAVRSEWLAKNLEHGASGLRLLGLAQKHADSP